MCALLCLLAMQALYEEAQATASGEQQPLYLKDDPRYGEASQKEWELIKQQLTNTTVVWFSVGNVNYRVPRNYISGMNNYNGGPQEMVTFKATYPGLEPLSDKTRQCLTQPRAYWPPGCIPLTFWIDGGAEKVGMPVISDDDHFNNSTRGYTGAIVKQTPNGLTLYQYGSGLKRSDIYRRKTESHNLFITCDYFDNHGKRDAICKNYYSPLPDGDNSLSYRLDLDQIDNAEKIDDGMRSLIASFTVKGNKP